MNNPTLKTFREELGEFEDLCVERENILSNFDSHLIAKKEAYKAIGQSRDAHKWYNTHRAEVLEAIYTVIGEG